MSCSFCGSRLHNIRACRDPNIDLLYERIKVIYIDMMNNYPDTIETQFKTVLNGRFNLRELRAVCATHTNFMSSRTKPQIINTLYQYYSSRIYPMQQQEEQPWLEVRRLPTQPDPIPDFASDLEQPLEEQPLSQEHNLTWYIDTTPSPIYSVLSLSFAMLQERRSRQALDYIYNSHIWRARNNTDINLNPYFNNVASTPQIKKYNIYPVLVSDEVERGEEECAICYESINCMDLVKLNCNHKFCGDCIKGTLKAHNNIYCGPSCALCRTQMVSFSVKNPEIYNMVAEHCNL